MFFPIFITAFTVISLALIYWTQINTVVPLYAFAYLVIVLLALKPHCRSPFEQLIWLPIIAIGIPLFFVYAVMPQLSNGVFQLY